MTQTDIICCYGNNWTQPPYPLLYGSRNKELQQVRWRLKELSMIDLDWTEDNWQKYKRQLLTVRKNRDKPVKYVVLPDLIQSQRIISTLNFGWALRKLDVFEVALLPVKTDINLDQLPSWIRPALPTLTNYMQKDQSDVDLCSFKDYNGNIHILGGGNIRSILEFVTKVAPKAQIRSIDFNSYMKASNYGNYLVDNSTRWEYNSEIGKHEAISKSFSTLVDTHASINKSVDKTAETLLRQVQNLTSLEDFFREA